MAPSLCPCGSQKPLSQCCQPILDGKRTAQTAEELLRARYTAFTQGNVDFVIASHHSRTSAELKREEIDEWSRSSEWLGLKIIQVEAGKEADTQGTLVFCAEYKGPDGKIVKHWEQSLFEKEEGAWKFLDARGLKNEPFRREAAKAGRNDPCTCGSGQKYKKCCGK